MRANISGQIVEGPTVTAMCEALYGKGAAVMPNADPNAPHFGNVVRRAYPNAWHVLGVVRWVEDDDAQEVGL